MAKIHLRRTLSGFQPVDAAGQDDMRRFTVGEIYRADIVKPRNYKHHCLFMALLELTFDNQDKYEDDWQFRTALALEIGHARQYVTLDGEIQFVPLRFSYDDIPDEEEATVLFGKALAVCAKLLHDMDLEDLALEVDRYAAGRRAA